MDAPTATPTSSPAPLARREKQPRQRPTYYFDFRAGTLATPDGRTLTLAREEGMRAVLAYLAANAADANAGAKSLVVYLVCGPLAGDAPLGNDTQRSQAWYRAPAADGWTVRLRWENPPRRVASYERDGLHVDLRHTSAWWDDCRDLARIRRASDLLLARLRRDFGEHVVLLGTPAQTGLDLLERRLPYEREYPVLPDDVRELLHSWSMPHRHDLLADGDADGDAGEGETIPGFAVLDTRLAYGACLRHVPCHFVGRDDGFDLLDRGWQPAWYRVTARVPDDWRGYGLLPAKGDEGWRWPRRPGERVEGWIHARLVAGARGRGWDVRIHERLVFDNNRPGSDPLETWTKALRAAYRDAARLEASHADDEVRAVGALLKAAVRHLLLDTIGALARRESRETVLYPRGVPFPFDPLSPPVTTAYGSLVTIRRELSRDQRRYQHIEWAAHVWAVAQSRITTRAGQLPAGCELLAFVGDELDVTRDPGWLDDGQPGSLRRKGIALAGPLPRPRDWLALETLRERAKGV